MLAAQVYMDLNSDVQYTHKKSCAQPYKVLTLVFWGQRGVHRQEDPWGVLTASLAFKVTSGFS